ncbi:helix-turn-helix domain-containing protein [Edaphocola flava]|uniref:helix-turn-helix domain-containing protein n=1 Tax=Edaphocola flava TaxID=2499629 RepID=UPI00100B3D76|nr:AraC family transcriptional regulator [Edaphocola flava]
MKTIGENTPSLTLENCSKCVAQDAGSMHVCHIGKGSVQEVFLKDFSICYGNVDMMRERLINYEYAEPSVKMLFQFCGSRIVKIDGFKEDVEMSCNSHTLLYTNINAGQVHYSGCEQQKFLEVNFKPSFLIPYLPNETIFSKFLSRIKDQKNAVLSGTKGLVSVPMQQVIDSIFDSKRNGALQHLFLESKVKELLLLQIESYLKSAAEDKAAVHKYHVDKIYQAKAIIEANIGHPCSLIDLAHQVGTNECTLKKGFRALLDTSVYSYWNDLKMQKAYKMLQESDASIADIALDTGFKTPQHFSTAFKKKYGITPGKVRTEPVAK